MQLCNYAVMRLVIMQLCNYAIMQLKKPQNRKTAKLEEIIGKSHPQN